MSSGGGVVNIGLVAGMAGVLAACAATKQRPSGGADAAAGAGDQKDRHFAFPRFRTTAREEDDGAGFFACGPPSR